MEELNITEEEYKSDLQISDFLLRYHVPNRHKDRKAYADLLPFMFYIFRSEGQLKAGELLSLSYSAKKQEAGVIDVMNENKSLVVPFSDMLEIAFLQFSSDLISISDLFLQQNNDHVNNELLERENVETEQSDNIQSSDAPHSFTGYANTSTQISTVLTDDDLGKKN